MARVENWEHLLADELAAWRDVEFEWGRADCLALCMSTAAAITDRVLPVVSDYSDEAGALAALSDRGFDDLAGLVSSEFTEIKPLTARRGDWVMVGGEATGGALGVVSGRRAAFMADGRGLVWLPIGWGMRAWRIE